MKMLGWILLLKIRDAGVCSVRGSLDLRGSRLSFAFCWCKESIGHTCCLQSCCYTISFFFLSQVFAAPLGFSAVD